MKPVQIPFSFPGSTLDKAPSDHSAMVHRAKWIVIDPWTIIENGYLHTANGTIIAVGSGPPPSGAPCMDHGPVALMPACVNAHTHLELSALGGKLPLNQGFRAWVTHLISFREALGSESLRRGAISGIEELVTGGSRLVGDISTLGLTFELLQRQSIAGICFFEHLGSPETFTPDLPANTQYLKAGLAGHAPHTTSPLLLQEIKRQSQKNGALMSIHVAESEDEVTFITTESGSWAMFLNQREIDFSLWPLPDRSPVSYLSNLGVLDENTLVVHLVFADLKDINLLQTHGVKVCLCPRSNHALHHHLPDIEALLSAGLRPCLGTDSLASVPSLSILDEMAFTATTFQNIPPETIFAMGTLYGAEALGYGSRLGTLHPGHMAAALAVSTDCHSKKNIIEAIVRSEWMVI